MFTKKKIQQLYNKDIPKERDELELINKFLVEALKINQDVSVKKLLDKSQKKIFSIVENKKKYVPKTANIEESKKKGGFDKPVKISKELQTFLKLDSPETTRRNVTLALNSYVHLNKEKTDEHHSTWEYLNPNDRDLRDPKDKRVVKLENDKDFAELLRYDEYIENVKLDKIFKDHKLEKYNQMVESERKKKSKRKEDNTEVEFIVDDVKYFNRGGRKYKVKHLEDTNKPKVRLIETDTTILLCTLQKLITVHFDKKVKIEPKDSTECEPCQSTLTV
uniref:DM2 domain-containing protein n=1 Tax=viral metagenome TaxID=1070528 RepID=A0A6C0JQL7_9ZZZZ